MGAYAVAWTWGGRPERFAAGVLLAYCLLSSITYRWEIGGLHLVGYIEDCIRLLIFGWLCLRSNRWWPFVIAGAIFLSVLVYSISMLDPGFPETAAFSAQVGLGYLIDLTLLLSPLERRLAGEAPAGRAAWATAAIATGARRQRADGPGLWDPVVDWLRKQRPVIPAAEFEPRAFRLAPAGLRRKGMTDRAPPC